MTAPVRFTANISMLFAEVPFLERIGAAAGAGFPAVECQFPYAFTAADIRSRLEEHGLPMNGINTSPGNQGEFGLAAVPGREGDFLRAMEQALDYSRVIGNGTIHCMSGCVADEDRGRARDTFLANMAAASDMAKEAGVDLLIEPINVFDRPGYFVSRSDEVVALLKDLGRSNVKLMFDCYHIQIMEGDLIRRIRRHWDHIGHFQFASVPDRHEPQEGEVAYGAVFAEIGRLGWGGWVGAEYRPRARTEDGLGWLQWLAPE